MQSVTLTPTFRAAPPIPYRTYSVHLRFAHRVHMAVVLIAPKMELQEGPTPSRQALHTVAHSCEAQVNDVCCVAFPIKHR